MKNKVLISFAIVFFIALQGFVVIGPQPELDGAHFWPFVDYPMYRYPHFKHSGIPFYSVYAVHPDGTDKQVTEEMLDISYWKFQEKVVKAFPKADAADRLRDFAGHYEKKYGKKVKAFRLEDKPVLITEKGGVPGRHFVIKTVEMG